MRIRTLLAAAAAAALLTPGAGRAESPNQFDLVCTGSELTNDGPATPWVERMSIDLDRNAFWDQKAARAAAFVRVEPGRLTLLDEKSPDFSGARTRAFFSIDRGTGQVYRFVDDILAKRWTGACVVAPFTPMPVSRF